MEKILDQTPSLKEAAGSVQSLERSFKHVLTVARALSEFHNFGETIREMREQAEKEKKAFLVHRVETEKAKERLSVVKAEAVKKEGEVKVLVEQANTEKDNIINQARTVAAAGQEASKKEQHRKQLNADRLVVETEKETKRLKKEAALYISKVAAAKAELQGMERKVKEMLSGV